MKSIDIKSLLIGIFMTSTLFLGLGAAGGKPEVVAPRQAPGVVLPGRTGLPIIPPRFYEETTPDGGRKRVSVEEALRRYNAWRKSIPPQIGSPVWLRAKGLTHPEWVAQGEPDNPVVNTGHILGPQVGAWANAQARASSANKLGGKANPIHVVIDSAP